MNEMAEIARRMGVVDPPTSASELAECLNAFRSELEVNHQAVDAVKFLRWPQIPLLSRPPYLVIYAAASTLLPNFAREMLSQKKSSQKKSTMPMLVEPLMIRPCTKAVLATVRWGLGPRPEISEAIKQGRWPARSPDESSAV